MPEKFIVEKNFENTRFDRWFKINILDIPQSLIEKIIRKKKIKINKKKTKTSYRVQEGDLIEIFDLLKIKNTEKPKKEKYRSSVSDRKNYEKLVIENNENFIVLNKPSGISVQAGTKSFKNIIDILKNTKFFKDKKPFIVHRIDKDTSGLLLIAKNREYAQLFTSLFRIRKIHKTYLAITHGKVSSHYNRLDDNLIVYENKKKIIQRAISYMKIIKSNPNYTLVEMNPVTGRKHQIRKQLYNIGNPIVGDDKYNTGKGYKNKKLMLHAFKIKFMINNVKYNYKANYNKEFEDFIKKNFK